MQMKRRVSDRDVDLGGTTIHTTRTMPFYCIPNHQRREGSRGHTATLSLSTLTSAIVSSRKAYRFSRRYASSVASGRCPDWSPVPHLTTLLPTFRRSLRGDHHSIRTGRRCSPNTILQQLGWAPSISSQCSARLSGCDTHSEDLRQLEVTERKSKRHWVGVCFHFSPRCCSADTCVSALVFLVLFWTWSLCLRIRRTKEYCREASSLLAGG